MTPATLIIPAHNRRDLTLGCLRHLEATGDLAAFAVAVVDDGSSDGTGSAVTSAFPSARLLRGDGNLFWTGAVRLAMETTPADHAIVWLNDDCLPEPGALDALMAHVRENPRSMAGPLCVSRTTGRAIATGFNGRSALAAEPGRIIPVEGLSGFCVALGAEAWTSLGLPDARRFPHYYGDTDYTLRASRSGLPVVLVGDARVQVAGGDGPARLRERVDPGLPFCPNWNACFASPKSPYRLATNLHYLRLKYGWGPGFLLFALKASGWIGTFLLLRVIGRPSRPA